MEGGKQEVLNINNEITAQQIHGNNKNLLDQNWYGLKPILPVASGGLNPLDIPELIETLGKDMVFQLGGGVHGHLDGTEAGAKAVRQALDATLNNIDLREYSKFVKELTRAFEKWGKHTINV
jgi:ribulose-bisphosphate carboxylase large chain